MVWSYVSSSEASTTRTSTSETSETTAQNCTDGFAGTSGKARGHHSSGSRSRSDATTIGSVSSYGRQCPSSEVGPRFSKPQRLGAGSTSMANSPNSKAGS